MHIQGTAFRGAFGTGQGMDLATWDVPATVPFTVGYDVNDPIGTATLTQAEDGCIEVDVTFDESHRPLTETRPYLGVCLVGGAPVNTVRAVGLLAATNDPQLPKWTEVT